MSFDITPYSNYIWAVIIIAGITISGRVIFNSSYFRTKARARVEQQKAVAKPKGLFDKIRGVLQDPDSALAEINKHIEDQRKQGVTDEQMQMLISEKSYIEKYAKNEFVQAVAEPVLAKVQEITRGFGLKL